MRFSPCTVGFPVGLKLEEVCCTFVTRTFIGNDPKSFVHLRQLYCTEKGIKLDLILIKRIRLHFM
jgi:hypothetical protein